MTEFTSFSQQPLSLEQIQKYAPSALAVAAHESRSSRYAYVPTVNVIKGMQEAGFFPFKASQSTTRDLTRRDFTKHMLRFRQMTGTISVGDVFAEVIMVNAHDGSSRYKMYGGLWRKKCDNGMCVSEASLASISVMHSGNIVEEVIAASNQIALQAGNVLDMVSRWTSLQLTSGEQHALAISAHTLRFADAEGKVNTPITPDQLLHIRRHDDSYSDLWTTFNRIQENVIKGGLSARAVATVDENGNYQRGRKVSTKQVKSIDGDIRLNRALWQLGEEMERLKKNA